MYTHASTSVRHSTHRQTALPRFFTFFTKLAMTLSVGRASPNSRPSACRRCCILKSSVCSARYDRMNSFSMLRMLPSRSPYLAGKRNSCDVNQTSTQLIPYLDTIKRYRGLTGTHLQLIKKIANAKSRSTLTFGCFQDIHVLALLVSSTRHQVFMSLLSSVSSMRHQVSVSLLSSVSSMRHQVFMSLLSSVSSMRHQVSVSLLSSVSSTRHQVFMSLLSSVSSTRHQVFLSVVPHMKTQQKLLARDAGCQSETLKYIT